MRARTTLARAIIVTGLAVMAAAPVAAADPPEVGNIVISTIAGTGELGADGDGGPATAAKVGSPFRIAADGAGNVFVAHSRPSENRFELRKINKAGVISPLAGGTRKPTAGGIPLAEASVVFPSDLATDSSGALYIADDDYRTVTRSHLYKVSGDVIRLIAGGGTEDVADGKLATAVKLGYLLAVTVAANGDIYIVADFRVLRIDHATSKITIVAGDGKFRQWREADENQPATKVPVSATALAVDSAGTVYVGGGSGGNTDRLRVVTTDGKIHTVACAGETPIADGVDAMRAKCAVSGFALDKAGRLVFVSGALEDHTVLALRDQSIELVAGVPYEGGFSGDGGRAAGAKLWVPKDVAADPTGNLYVADNFNNRIRKLSRQRPPVAKDDSATTEAGKPAKGDVLANDTGTKLTVTAHTGPRNGTLSIPADGRFSYEAKAGFTGTDSFGYTVTDSAGQQATATVTITVKPGAVPSSPAPPGAGAGPGAQPPVAQAANVKQDKGLASTGASVLWLAVAAGALLLVGGGLVVVTLRRRRSRA